MRIKNASFLVAMSLVFSADPGMAQSFAGDRFIALPCTAGFAIPGSTALKVTNTSGATLPASTKILWTVRQVGSGNASGPTLPMTTRTGAFSIQAELADQQSVSFTIGGPSPLGSLTTCSSKFNAGRPDIKLGAVRIGGGSVFVSISNPNPWIDAGPSTLRLSYDLCLSNLTTLTVALELDDTPGVLIKKASTLVLEIPYLTGIGEDHVTAIADIFQEVAESNELNNEMSDPRFSYCVP